MANKQDKKCVTPCSLVLRCKRLQETALMIKTIDKHQKSCRQQNAEGGRCSVALLPAPSPRDNMTVPPPIKLAPLGNVRSRCEAKHAKEYVEAWTKQLLEHKQALKDAGADTTTLCDRITLAGRVYPGESAAGKAFRMWKHSPLSQSLALPLFPSDCKVFERAVRRWPTDCIRLGGGRTGRYNTLPLHRGRNKHP